MHVQNCCLVIKTIAFVTFSLLSPSSDLKVPTYATGRERKEDGKPRVTNVTIILLEITFRQTSLSFKQIFW